MMGYSFPEKNLAMLLYGVTGGNRALADEMWEKMSLLEFSSWQAAWDWMDRFLDGYYE